jgi:phosphatidylserine/phosphatidylglycerophosphate/cardiolipin synthase-like enzyme
MMPRWLAATAGLLILFAQPGAREPRTRDLLDLYKAPSRGTDPAAAAPAGVFVPPVADWRWYEGEAGCELSPIARQVDRVVRATMVKNPAISRLSTDRFLTTRRNAFGPTLMDGKAIFEAAGRLIEVADAEVDLMSFAIEPDAEPYLALVRAFERRLLSGRPLARPFRIRIYADHLSPLYKGAVARPRAKALLEPWLAIYRKHRLDPRAMPIEVYVHAHGPMFYHHGARYSVHDKLFIVDGRYVHIGGANPQAKNNFDHPERDTAAVMKGEIARAALDAFDGLWAESDFSCGIQETGGQYRSSCTNRRTPFAVEHDAAVVSPDLDAIGVSGRACLPMTILSKGKRGYSNFEGYTNPWAKGLLAAVASAERHVALTSPNMNAPPLQAALVEAIATRDVRVNLLLPYARNEDQVNFFGGLGSNTQSVNVIRACGVDARARSAAEFEQFRSRVEVAWWVAEGHTTRFSGDGAGCYHIKFASFDDRALIVGSGNLDDQSFYHSTETSILVDSEVVTRAVTEFVFLPEWRRAERVALWTRWTRAQPDGRQFPLEVMEPGAFGLCAGLSYSLK